MPELKEKLTEAECLQIALGVYGCCMNAGFAQGYVLTREVQNGRGTSVDTNAVVREVYDVLDAKVRAAQLAEMRN